MLKECAVAFLKHGCKAVVLMSRKLEKLQVVATELNNVSQQNNGGVCVAMAGDVRNYDSCANVVKQVVA